jgi:hypothetical protein
MLTRDAWIMVFVSYRYMYKHVMFGLARPHSDHTMSMSTTTAKATAVAAAAVAAMRRCHVNAP